MPSKSAPVPSLAASNASHAVRSPRRKPAQKSKTAPPTRPLPKRASTPARVKRPSALDAAFEVLSGLDAKATAAGLTTPELIDRMRKDRLWTSPAGKTPHATLCSAIIREISNRKSASRFKRVAPGRFAASKAARRSTPNEARGSKANSERPGEPKRAAAIGVIRQRTATARS